MRLFVGNLPYSATETDLETFFGQAGVTVDSVNVMRDRFSGKRVGLDSWKSPTMHKPIMRLNRATAGNCWVARWW